MPAIEKMLTLTLQLKLYALPRVKRALKLALTWLRRSTATTKRLMHCTQPPNTAKWLGHSLRGMTAARVQIEAKTLWLARSAKSHSAAVPVVGQRAQRQGIFSKPLVGRRSLLRTLILAQLCKEAGKVDDMTE